jgi:hypothetical protein
LPHQLTSDAARLTLWIYGKGHEACRGTHGCRFSRPADCTKQTKRPTGISHCGYNGSETEGHQVTGPQFPVQSLLVRCAGHETGQPIIDRNAIPFELIAPKLIFSKPILFKVILYDNYDSVNGSNHSRIERAQKPGP